MTTTGLEARPASVALLTAAVGTDQGAATVATALAATVADAEPAERDALVVAALRAAVPGNADALTRRGLPRDVAEATVADVDRKLDRYGLRGADVDWLVAVVTGRVVAVGRLQFELGDHLADGSPAWGVHVPETGPLDPEDCDRSFARAPGLLRRLAPDRVAERWRCRSWLLDPGLAAVLGPDANTVRFARRFRLDPPGPHDAAEGDDSVAKFVFGVPLATARASAPTGRLRAAVLDRWASGGHWTERTGTAPVA
ncbi:hypothetical protein DEI99_016375 [Curtobacterium sp. MCLR17_036]|uniref:hypothetical protein n=1 Tax=Curtobacterium sp. MCLR17_036 TaxID=2175620 RepID=UPI000DAA88D6|nr:hypothetical protein [Curtobacterium sp. MCLR17_036]WIE64786.1 hypothetical protein DEI99_016375 [Curtobacterium sp. MCLR17_036]